jgi:hypothetical protein
MQGQLRDDRLTWSQVSAFVDSAPGPSGSNRHANSKPRDERRARTMSRATVDRSTDQQRKGGRVGRGQDSNSTVPDVKS